MTVSLKTKPVRYRMAESLAERIGHRKFEMWFANADIAVVDDALDVAVANRFAADWIDHHFHDALLAVAEQTLGPAARVHVHVNAATAPAPAADAQTAPAATRPAPAAAARPAAAKSPDAPTGSLRHRLDDFIVGPSNELAYTAACRLVDEPDAPLNPLFIHGACGLGKTHLLQGLTRRFIERHPAARWRYTTAEQFTNQYIAAVQANKLGEFRRRLRRLDLLVVDDVHFFSNKAATQTEFLHTFDAIDLHGAKLVFASDAHPKLIRPFSEALISRFLSGMVVRIDAPDAATRRQLVISLAARQNITLNPAAIELLAEHPVPSVREIVGTLNRLAATAAITQSPGDPIGAALVRQVLAGSSASPIGRRPVPLKQIVDVVCEQLAVEREQVMDRCRHRRVVLARSLIIHLARQLTTLSYPELARGLARPNHSSIITAHQRIAKQINDQRPAPPDPHLQITRVDLLADQLKRCILESA